MSFESVIYSIVHSPKKKYHDHDTIRKIVVLTSFCLLAIITTMFFGIESHIISKTNHRNILLITGSLIFLSLIIFRITGNFYLYVYSIIIMLGIFCIYLVLSGGRYKTGFIWCLIFPITTFYLIGDKRSFIINGILFVVFNIILILPKTPIYNITYSIPQITRFLFAYLFVTLLSYTLAYSRNRAQNVRDKVIEELQDAPSRVKKLSGLLPICAKCKKIRNDEGYWEEVETYFKSHSEADFTHGMCQDCSTEMYGEQPWFKDSESKKKQ